MDALREIHRTEIEKSFFFVPIFVFEKILFGKFLKIFEIFGNFENFEIFDFFENVAAATPRVRTALRAQEELQCMG